MAADSNHLTLKTLHELASLHIEWLLLVTSLFCPAVQSSIANQMLLL